MPVIGNLHVRVQYGTQAAKLVLVVVAGEGPSLFGRNWLNHIRPNLTTLTAVRTVMLKSLNGLMQQHASLFSDTLGTVEPFRATLHVLPDATPKFRKARSVPFAIKEAIGKELDYMEQQGILQKVSHSEWAAPIVPVPKKDGRFRICGDYKVTINPSLSVDQYPLPKPLSGRYLRIPGRRYDLRETRPFASLPSTSTGREVGPLRNHQHTSGVVPSHPTSIWCGLGTRRVPENDGHCTTGNFRRNMLHR